MRTYPYAFHIALDGNGLNGLEGLPGVCLFRYDPRPATTPTRSTTTGVAPAGTPER